MSAIDSRPTPISAPRVSPFAKGNPGRKPGSKNRATLLRAAALLQARLPDLLRTVIDRACDGNVPLLKFLLGCSLPRNRLITMDLPRIETADDAVAANDRIIEEVTTGKITPSEGAAVGTLIKSQAQTIELADLVKRLDELEALLRERGAI